MRTGRIILVVGFAFVFLVGIVGGCSLYGSYKTAISLDEGVKSAWADVATDLQRRYDLIPNIVETVKGYAKHEKEIVDNIANARTQYFNAKTPNEQAEAAGSFGQTLSRLLVLQEKYPDLKANQNFMALMDQLEGTENRVAEKRRRYNEAVKELNTHIRGPIGSITAGWAGVKAAERFEADAAAKEAPKVSFTNP